MCVWGGGCPSVDKLSLECFVCLLFLLFFGLNSYHFTGIVISRASLSC